jgi:hypothetical protein
LTVSDELTFSDICTTTTYVKDNGTFACGFYLEKGKTWTEAAAECKLKGGRLPEILSFQENKDIFERMVCLG